LKENRNKLLNFEKQKVKHPLCSENVTQSQVTIKNVLNHPSMPKSKYLPEYGLLVESDSIQYDESNETELQKKTYKYIPSDETPLSLYLNFIKKS